MKILKYIINRKVVAITSLLLIFFQVNLSALKTHKVRKGETLYAIAKKYKITVDELKSYNNMTSNKLQPGQRLNVEAKKSEKKTEKKKTSSQRSNVQEQNRSQRDETPRTQIVKKTEKQYYKVKKGDTISSIARRNGTTIDVIKKLNHLKNNKLRVGQRLTVGETVVNTVTEQPTEFSEPIRLAEKNHVVKKGQTLYSISKMYNLDVVDILDYNNLKSFEIKEGQKIWLEPGHQNALNDDSQEATPTVTENKTPQIAVHIVARGENLFRIAKNYNVKVEDVKKWNNLSSLTVKEGQSLYIGDPAGMNTRDIEYIKQNKQSFLPFSKTPVLPLSSVKIISEFGMRQGRMHKGLDFSAPKGEPIFAVLPGKVVFSGVQRGYGNVVIIEHDNFVMTVYGHNETNLVKFGDEVTQGQIIGLVGNTGNANGPHLHFEYRVRAVALDPRDFLPGLPR